MMSDTCFFYSDNICRKNNNDCLKCLKAEYDDLYILNYKNQVKAEEKYNKLHSKYYELKQKCERLIKENKNLRDFLEVTE